MRRAVLCCAVRAFTRLVLLPQCTSPIREQCGICIHCWLCQPVPNCHQHNTQQHQCIGCAGGTLLHDGYVNLHACSGTADNGREGRRISLSACTESVCATCSTRAHYGIGHAPKPHTAPLATNTHQGHGRACGCEQAVACGDAGGGTAKQDRPARHEPDQDQGDGQVGDREDTVDAAALWFDAAVQRGGFWLVTGRAAAAGSPAAAGSRLCAADRKDSPKVV